MRQKDKCFAETLNHIRKYKRGQKLQVQDEVSLKQHETGTDEYTEERHIFPPNSEAQTHNFDMLHKLCCDVQIHAQDFDKDPQTGRFTRRSKCS